MCSKISLMRWTMKKRKRKVPDQQFPRAHNHNEDTHSSSPTCEARSEGTPQEHSLLLKLNCTCQEPSSETCWLLRNNLVASPTACQPIALYTTREKEKKIATCNTYTHTHTLEVAAGPQTFSIQRHPLSFAHLWSDPAKKEKLKTMTTEKERWMPDLQYTTN